VTRRFSFCPLFQRSVPSSTGDLSNINLRASPFLAGCQGSWLFIYCRAHLCGALPFVTSLAFSGFTPEPLPLSGGRSGLSVFLNGVLKPIVLLFLITVFCQKVFPPMGFFFCTWSSFPPHSVCFSSRFQDPLPYVLPLPLDRSSFGYVIYSIADPFFL